MNENRQSRFNVAAGSMLLLAALIRAVDTIDSIVQISKLRISWEWEIWLTVIGSVALVVLMALAGVVMLKGRDDLYAKAMLGIGVIILGEYLIVVIDLFRIMRFYGGISYLFRWQFILLYGAMICHGLCYVLAGKYAQKAYDEPDPSTNSRWLQAPGAFVLSIVFLIIVAIASNTSPLEMISSTPSEQWIQILSFALDFLVLLFAGMYFRGVETENYRMKQSRLDMNGIPPYINGNPANMGSMYQPYGSDAQRFGAQQAFGAGIGFAAQQYNAQQNGAPYGQGYGTQQNRVPYGQGYGSPQNSMQNAMKNGQMYGQTAGVDLSRGIDMPQKDLSKGIDMPSKQDTSSTIDKPQGINVPPMVDLPQGDFDELLGYGRQQGYGQNQVDIGSSDDVR